MIALYYRVVFVVWVLPHKSVSSQDNGLPSVTTVRITKHNGASAAVLPVQGKQQEAVVVDSALIKPSLRMGHFSFDFKCRLSQSI